MFLWAKLVMESLFDIVSIGEQHAAITEMPKELPKFYAAIFGRLTVLRSSQWVRYTGSSPG